MAAPEHFEFAGGPVVVDTHACPGHDPEDNEDGVGVVALGEAGVALIVADGVGGHGNGAGAAEVAVDSLMRAAQSAGPDAKRLQSKLLEALEHANESIMEQFRGAATTVAVATILEGRLRAYHVGDSGVIVCSQRGRVKLRTVGHSPVGYAIGAGMIESSDVLEHDEHHLVSNVVGMEAMTIDVGTGFELAARDTVILATDGLLDNVSDEEVVECVRTGSLLESAESLRDLVRTRTQPASAIGKPDDHAFVLHRVRAGEG
jgi:protein phosphatase